MLVSKLIMSICILSQCLANAQFFLTSCLEWQTKVPSGEFHSTHRKVELKDLGDFYLQIWCTLYWS